MYVFFKNVFLITLFLYIITLIFVSYVGVYLTYVAIPVIVISGVIAYFLEPKEMTVSKPSTDSERKKQIIARLKEIEGDK